MTEDNFVDSGLGEASPLLGGRHSEHGEGRVTKCAFIKRYVSSYVHRTYIILCIFQPKRSMAGRQSVRAVHLAGSYSDILPPLLQICDRLDFDS